jgi:hypothetical protein
MPVVVDDKLVADPLYFLARTRGAKRPQADGDTEDAVEISADGNDGAGGIVEGQRGH